MSLVEYSNERLTKRQRKLASKNAPVSERNNLTLKHVFPLTDNQERMFEAFSQDKNLFLHGSAGTGKTFGALYLSLMELMHGHSDYKKIIIIRSVVPTRDMGFLPGNAKEKSKVYEAPYYAICSELLGRGDAYELLKTKGIIEFMTTSFIRGVTLSDCIIIADESENMNFQELDSIITRVGDNCKLIYAGDFRQSDFAKHAERKGILDFMRIIKKLKSFATIEFNRDDIIRSETVKNYIIAKEEIEDLSSKTG